jgi:hypothetical protein
MTGREIGEKMLSAVKDYVGRKVGELSESVSKRLDDLSEKLKELDARPVVIGPQGERGDDGKSVSVDEVTPIILSEIEKHVSKIERPKDGINGKSAFELSGFQGTEKEWVASLKGTDGRDGLNGKDGESIVGPEGKPGKDGESIVGPEGKPGQDGERGKSAYEIAKDHGYVGSELDWLKSIEGKPGLDGQKGESGQDGDDGLDALEIDPIPFIDDTKRYPRGVWAKHNGGLWRSYETTEGFKGWECVVSGTPNVEIIQSDERTINIVVTKSDGEKVDNIIKFPAMIYRGIWREGLFEKGDTVTWNGSLWIAEKDTNIKPGEKDSGWRLSVKKGQDGKGGEPPAPIVPVRLR